MAICPYCDGDVTEWAQRLEKAPAASTPKVWTCPECDTILGISDWGTAEVDRAAEVPGQPSQ